jgi:hypothetical protein
MSAIFLWGLGTIILTKICTVLFFKQKQFSPAEYFKHHDKHITDNETAHAAMSTVEKAQIFDNLFKSMNLMKEEVERIKKNK